MAAHRRDDASRAEGQDRRTFLKTLGLAGGALAGAGAAAAAPVRIGPRRSVTATPTPRVGLQRADTKMSLTQPLALQKTAPGGPELQPPPPLMTPDFGPVPLPSTRRRALETVFYSMDTDLVPADFGIRRMEDGQFTVAREVVLTYDTALAHAYEEGITLTPSGCEYAPGVEYEGEPPMKYIAFRTTYVSPEVFGKRVPVITRATEHTWFFNIQWRTPGSAAMRRTYVLELSMEKFDPAFDITLHSMASEAGQGQTLDVTFAPTTEDTQMALVEMPGSGEAGYTHQLWFRPAYYSEMYAYFNWLNIIAV